MAQLTQQEIKEEKENKTIAGISTAVILSLLFILLLFLAFGSTSIAEELEGGGGVAVSLGEPDAGGPSTESSAPQTKKTTSQAQADDPLLSQDNDDAPVVKKTTTKKTEEKKQKVDDDLSDILGDLSKRKKTQGSGSGTKTGNEGEKNGKDDGNGNGGKGTGGDGNGTSTGKGSGVSYSLGGRKMTQAPPSSNDFYTSGKVTVKITVNRSGKVVSASIGRPSSNDVQLQRLAKQLAFKTKFQANLTAPAEQFGTITINFKL